MSDDPLLDDYKKPVKSKIEKAKDRARTALFSQRNRSLEAKGMDKKYHQAILKVTGYLGSKDKLMDHLSYISRNGKLDLDGNEDSKVQGKEAHEDMAEEWRSLFSRKVQDASKITKYTLTFKANSPEEQADLLSKVNEQSTDYLSGVRFRVDKSRSKKDPFSVILRTYESSNDMDTYDLVNSMVEERFSDVRVKVDEKKPKMSREAVKIMLSTPAGTDPEKTHRAAKRFAEALFGERGFDYIYAVHSGDEETENPHAHLVVNLNNLDGSRLKTDKMDLHKWRQEWAKYAREEGIYVEASYRSERGIGKTSGSSRIRMMQKHRGKQPDIYKDNSALLEKIKSILTGDKSNSEWEDAILKKNMEERERYLKDAEVLRLHAEENRNTSSYKETIALARVLEKESKELPIPETKTVIMARQELGIIKRDTQSQDLDNDFEL